MNGDINQALTSFLLAAVTLATIAITTFVIPWIKAHATQQQIQTAEKVATNAVQAVEQIGGSGSHQKFNDALERARRLAAAKGIQLTDEQWRTLIESAVNDVKRWGQEIKVTAPQDAGIDVSAIVTTPDQPWQETTQ